MKAILGGALVALLLVTVPGLVAALLAAVGAACVWAATSPPVLAFAAGALAGPRIAHLVRSHR